MISSSRMEEMETKTLHALIEIDKNTAYDF